MSPFTSLFLAGPCSSVQSHLIPLWLLRWAFLLAIPALRSVGSVRDQVAVPGTLVITAEVWGPMLGS